MPDDVHIGVLMRCGKTIKSLQEKYWNKESKVRTKFEYAWTTMGIGKKIDLACDPAGNISVMTCSRVASEAACSWYNSCALDYDALICLCTVRDIMILIISKCETFLWAKVKEEQQENLEEWNITPQNIREW